MRRTLLLLVTMTFGVGGLLGGCGSTKTTTVTVSNAPQSATSTTSTQRATSTTSTSTPTASTPIQTTTNGGAAAPSTTRTETAPAFTHQETSSSEGTAGAAAIVRSHGYTPNNTSEYHPTQTLSVLIGTRTGSSDGYGQQAFFFLGGKYIGTDTKEPSATVKVISQSDTKITLAYPLYHKSDPLSSPSGGQTNVTFELNDGKLTPTGPIPPANSSSALSRN
jgi:LppP/LprE lipoprotein